MPASLTTLVKYMCDSARRKLSAVTGTVSPAGACGAGIRHAFQCLIQACRPLHFDPDEIDV